MLLVQYAAAKINLYLEITGRLENGYHSMRMLNQTVDLCDKLTLADGTGGLTLSCDEKNIPTDKSNLVLRAAEEFLKASGLALPAGGLHCILEKKIPSQAGLGGGSADAAAALKMLQKRFSSPLSKEKLFELAENLGADVPFSLLEGTARAEGKGEILMPLPPLKTGCFLIAKPSVGVSTKAAFEAFDREKTRCGGDFFAAKEALEQQNLSNLGNLVYNHFEALCEGKEIRQIKEKLLSFGALGAAMTGSGSAVFGLFETEKAANETKKQMMGQVDFLALARPCSASPAID